MKSKINLLFLGSGVYLKNLVKKIKKEKFTKFLVDLNIDGSTSKIIKKNYRIDLNNKEKIHDLAKKLKIEAVITNQNDFAMISYGYLCTKLSLPGIPYGFSDGLNIQKLHVELHVGIYGRLNSKYSRESTTTNST